MSSHEIGRSGAWSGSMLICAMVLCVPTAVLANLAVFSTSDIQRSGNLVPIRKTRIELVNERFTARLEAEAARVTVDYEFVNTGGDEVVTVGFPVDLMPPAGEGSTYNLVHWQKDSLQDLRITDGVTVVPIERTTEETLRPEDRPKLARDVAITRRWSRYEGGPKREVLEQTLVDEKFDDRVTRFPMAIAQFLNLPSGPEGILETVKLTVLEVYPGASNAPWAISEIYVYGVNGEK